MFKTARLVTVKITVSWDVTMCSLVVTNTSEERPPFMFLVSDNGGSSSLWNVHKTALDWQDPLGTLAQN